MKLLRRCSSTLGGAQGGGAKYCGGLLNVVSLGQIDYSLLAHKEQRLCWLRRTGYAGFGRIMRNELCWFCQFVYCSTSSDQFTRIVRTITAPNHKWTIAL